jgi:hypothetical protein
MMTPFGPYQALVLPSVAAEGGGITVFDERVDVMGSNFASSRPRLLNGTTFAKLGAACAARIGFSTVKVSGFLPIEMLLPRPDGLGSATEQGQNDSLPVRMTLAVQVLNNENYDIDRVYSFLPPASCHPAIGRSHIMSRRQRGCQKSKGDKPD